MRLRCIAVRDEAPSIRTFVVQACSGEAIPFQAGQALTLDLSVDGISMFRTFSIASSAARPDALDFTVKQAGVATRWMHRALLPGVEMESVGPHGDFLLPETSGPLALLSAGSGATPLISMLRTLADARPDADVAWLHVARTPDDVLFGPALQDLQARMPALSVSVAVTRSTPGWFGYRGRPERRMLAVAIPDLAARDVRCCGPAPFMAMMRRVHAAEGGAPDRFATEHFGPVPVSPASRRAQTSLAASSAELDGRVFAVRAGETILQAAGRAAVVIPSGCGRGLCGTCRLRLRAGRVEMRHGGGLTPAQERDGWVLACSSRPCTDVVLGSV